MSEKE